MTRSVRLPDHAFESIESQLPAGRAASFRALDLREALVALSVVDWMALPQLAQSPGVRRFTVESARTVAGFHLLVGLDPWADEPDAVVVHVIDIWADEWPS